MRSLPRYAVLAAILAAALAVAAPAAAQRQIELGVDAGATFGLGDQSYFSINVPASRFRVGFFQPGSKLSIEPAARLGYEKTDGDDNLLTYELEVGALYHFRPTVIATAEPSSTTSRVSSPYVRPFLGLSGFSVGDASDSQFIIGAGLGTKIPWRRDLSLRFEANLGYGFDSEAMRVGVLAGLSFFPR
jgi:opacity protein-like surface antigen